MSAAVAFIAYTLPPPGSPHQAPEQRLPYHADWSNCRHRLGPRDGTPSTLGFRYVTSGARVFGAAPCRVAQQSPVGRRGCEVSSIYDALQRARQGGQYTMPLSLPDGSREVAPVAASTREPGAIAMALTPLLAAVRPLLDGERGA